MPQLYQIATSPSAYAKLLDQGLHENEFALTQVDHPGQLDGGYHHFLVLDRALVQAHPLSDWHAAASSILILRDVDLNQSPSESCVLLPATVNPVELNGLCTLLGKHGMLQNEREQFDHELSEKQDGASMLVQVGIALSSEPDLDKLLSKILEEGCRLVSCDAASLFLIDRSDEQTPQLKFKLTYNASIPVSFEERSVALTESSIVGHCALSSSVVNIEDAYHIDEDVPYSFNRSFDKVMGYRTISLLAIPMLDHEGKVVGVLEFINRKRDRHAKLSHAAEAEQQVISFESTQIDLMRALSSQAAIAIENRKLIDDIHQLFDGFVSASVFAIEQRDPCTSGHSFRVANLSELLALAVDQTDAGILQNVSFSDNQMRELRFAALLHDFGKVGVRENVLTKAKKLSSERLQMLKYRIAMAKQQLEIQYQAQLLSLFEDKTPVTDLIKQKLRTALDEDIALLDRYLEVILSANEPSILEQEKIESLEAIKGHLFSDVDGQLRGLLTDEEFSSLSILKGSLNQQERAEIESHVNHTVEFLKLIPWTGELINIPQIAGAHHEKLDGSGYPNQLKSEEIPYQSRIMTVCDIYDALTAADRPYKPAMPAERALNILESEARIGMLDSTVVNVFVESKCYLRAEKSTHQHHPSTCAKGYAHHVCDFDLRPDA